MPCYMLKFKMDAVFDLIYKRIQAYLARRILPRYKYRYLVSEDILRMRVDSLIVHEIMASLQKRQLHFFQYAIKVGFE